MRVDTIDYFYQDIAMVGWYVALIIEIETTKVMHNDRGAALSFKMCLHHRIYD